MVRTGKYHVGQNLGQENDVASLMTTWETEKENFTYDGGLDENDFNDVGRYVQVGALL